MSGHSRWSQIKHKKSLTDKKRGQIFSKLSKLISIAARTGTNPETNLELKNAIDKARSLNMPNDNIERAVKKISEAKNHLEEVYVEAIGPGGIALLIKAVTANRNRTIAEIKSILAEHGSKMVPPGSISWMFSQPISVKNQNIHQKIDRLFEVLDDHADVENIVSNLKA